MLDNVTLSWLTNTAFSAARLYWEPLARERVFCPKGVSIPVAVSVFPDELLPCATELDGAGVSKLIHYNKLDKGGHFAAWEQPKLFSEEIRAGSSRCGR